MVTLSKLPTDSEPTPISEQEEGELEDQLDATMEQPVAERLVVAAAGEGFVKTQDDPPPVAEAACEEKGEEPQVIMLTGQLTPPEAESPTHEEQIECATRGVADAALNQAKAQKATKLAKKEFDYSVEFLQDLVDKGPEVYPLFDGQKSGQEKVEIVEYEPPLEKGQVRVRVIAMETAPGELAETAGPGTILICYHDPDGVLYWKNGDDDGCYFVEDDRYEVLEDWPDDVAGAVLHLPPIQFGPPTDDAPETVETAETLGTDALADYDSDAWRAVPIADALVGLAPRRLASLIEVAPTMGDLENYRMAINSGQEKWPKGIGPAAVTVIEEMILNWLRDNH